MISLMQDGKVNVKAVRRLLEVRDLMKLLCRKPAKPASVRVRHPGAARILARKRRTKKNVVIGDREVTGSDVGVTEPVTVPGNNDFSGYQDMEDFEIEDIDSHEVTPIMTRSSTAVQSPVKRYSEHDDSHTTTDFMDTDDIPQFESYEQDINNNNTDINNNVLETQKVVTQRMVDVQSG